MSGKSSKKPGKKLSVPREMAAIEADYRQLAAEAGQTQYRIVIAQEELKNTNDKIRLINNEAAARQQLDKEAADRLKAEQTPQPPVGHPEEQPVSGAV